MPPKSGKTTNAPDIRLANNLQNNNLQAIWATVIAITIATLCHNLWSIHRQADNLQASNLQENTI